MPKIILGKLEKNGEELAAFLRARLGESVNLEGDVITIGEASEGATQNQRRIKTYVKRFLHNERLKGGFRVLVAKGELRVVELLREEGES